MPASKLVGLAGYIIVIPIVLAAIWAFQYVHPVLADGLYQSLDIDDRDTAGVVALIAYVVGTLFIALPGLLLISMSEMAEAAEEQKELTQAQLSKLDTIIQVQRDLLAKTDR